MDIYINMDNYDELEDVFEIYLEDEDEYVQIPGKIFRNKFDDFEDKSLEYYIEDLDISILIEFEAI